MAEEISEKVKAFLSFNLNLETAIEDYQSRHSQASMAELLGPRWKQDTKKEDFPLATASSLSHFATYLDTEYVEDDEELELDIDWIKELCNPQEFEIWIKEQLDKLIDDDPADDLSRTFFIGNSEEMDYENIESFRKDINYERASQIIKDCYENSNLISF